MQNQLRQMLRERRDYVPGSTGWQWRTRAAWHYLLVIRKVPAHERQKFMGRLL